MNQDTTLPLLPKGTVDAIVLQHMGAISLPEGNPVQKLNAYRALVLEGARAAIAAQTSMPEPHRLFTERCGHPVFTIEQLQQAQGVPVKPAPVAQMFTEGHCAEKRKPGGCHLHNLQCDYPTCDRRAAVQAPAPQAEPRNDAKAAIAMAMSYATGEVPAWVDEVNAAPQTDAQSKQLLTEEQLQRVRVVLSEAADNPGKPFTLPADAVEALKILCGIGTKGDAA